MRNYSQWFANSRNNLGLLYEYSGDLAKARYNYESAVTQSPSFALAWHNLYLLAYRQQDRMRAAEAYQRLMSLDPQRAREAAEAVQTLR